MKELFLWNKCSKNADISILANFSQCFINIDKLCKPPSKRQLLSQLDHLSTSDWGGGGGGGRGGESVPWSYRDATQNMYKYFGLFNYFALGGYSHTVFDDDSINCM